MHEFEIVLALLVAVVFVSLAARRFAIPAPVLLVVGGLIIALIPGLPSIEFNPQLIFVVFIPPLLYRAALVASWRDLRANLPSITQLGVGLVVFTTIVVGVAVHEVVPALPWAAAFALGAIVAPPDAPAATAFLRELVVPRRLATILEGESLVNDATAIVAYRIAVAAAVTGVFSLAQAAERFVLIAVGGVAVGLAVGSAIGFLRRHVHAPEIEATISILTPFAAYFPADLLGVSGVLSVLTTGLFLARLGPRLLAPDSRLVSEGMWQFVVFVLEGLTFIFVGLELRIVLGALRGYPKGELLLAAIAISAATIIARMVWVFGSTHLRHLGVRLSTHFRRLARQASPTKRRTALDPLVSWRQILLVAWAGLRGADSLVLALALPLTTLSGAPFPGRNLIIFLTYVVIVFTLVVQGFTLRPIVNKLGICDTGATQKLEEAHARQQAADAALKKLDELAPKLDAETLTEFRSRYNHRHQRFSARVRAERDKEEEALVRSRRDVLRELLGVERSTVIGLRDRGMIGDYVMRRVQRDLDLEALLLESR
ncbi:MAG TPA: Na+/H+ antiporter [Gemmatimonadales bacterium]|nr:Na+/H+ antiporter [Gemmatimonadales bacterium]